MISSLNYLELHATYVRLRRRTCDGHFHVVYCVLNVARTAHFGWFFRIQGLAISHFHDGWWGTQTKHFSFACRCCPLLIFPFGRGALMTVVVVGVDIAHFQRRAVGDMQPFDTITQGSNIRVFWLKPYSCYSVIIHMSNCMMIIVNQHCILIANLHLKPFRHMFGRWNDVR